jgi:hypothetical protein
LAEDARPDGVPRSGGSHHRTLRLRRRELRLVCRPNLVRSPSR